MAMKKNFLMIILFVFFALGFSITTPSKVDIYFSPQGGCREAIISRILGAQNRVDIAIYSFTNVDISTALDSVARRGVKIRVLMDQSQGKTQYSANKLLLANGIPVRYGAGSGIMHNKFAIIDDSITITGSYNWSEAAEVRNDENLLVLFSDEVAHVFGQHFNSLWVNAFIATVVSEQPGVGVPRGENIGTRTQGAPLKKDQSGAEVTVYITRTGKKYHRAGCRYLAKSMISVSLKEAKQRGFGPCSVCGPPE
jgi:hypothetical protein